MSEQPEQAGFHAPEPEQLAAYFPSYDIERLIASGGMGAVYSAVQRSLERTVAIKILPMEFSADAAFCEAFEAEAKAMARLNHPNLIGVYDFGEVGGMLYIVMEYVNGGSLHLSSHGLAIDSREVVRLVSGIGLGLAHAHEHGILHRDIKPANILLDMNAQPKIGDFGLARPVDRKVREGEEIFGTPHYTAPEVVEAPQTVDARADIFSLGVLLHELLTGKLPADDPRTPSEIIGCDRKFDAIVARATRHDAQFRYPTATEFVKDLQAVFSQPGPVAKIIPNVAPGAPIRVPRKAVAYKQKKKSSGFPTGLVLFLLIMAGAGYYFYKKQHKAPAPPAVEAPKSNTGTDDVDTNVSSLPRVPKSAEKDHVEDSQGEESVFGTPVGEAPSGATRKKQLDSSRDHEATSQSSAMEEPIGSPLFDVTGFLQKGRVGMQRIAKAPLTSHQQAIKLNCQTFQRQLSEEIRKLSNSKREAMQQVLDADYQQWQSAEYRIPEYLSDKYSSLDRSDAIHTAALEKQENLDKDLTQQLYKLSGSYITGLQKQIDTLRTQNDPNAIKLLELEVNKVKDTPEYFAALVTGKSS